MFVDCAPSQHPLKHSPTSNSCTWPSGLLIEPTRLGKPSTGVAEQDGMHFNNGSSLHARHLQASNTTHNSSVMYLNQLHGPLEEQALHLACSMKVTATVSTIKMGEESTTTATVVCCALSQVIV